jgi:hypothetical protein
MQLMNIFKWVKYKNGYKEIFETQYLKQPTQIDFETCTKINKALSFPNVFASLNCMHS